MVNEHYLDDGSVFIRCWTAGAGRQVLLLHEWGESLRSVTRIFQDFAATFAVTAIDLPGHGRSGVPGRPWDLSDYCESLLNIMDKLELRQPDIVAHGFGGRIAIKLASAQPARVGNLVLVDTLGVGENANVLQAVKSAVPWPRLLGGKVRMGADSTRWIHQEATREDLKPLLPSIRCRTLLVWGDNDRKVPPAIGVQMKKLIRDSSIVVLEGAGHFSYQDQLTEFSRVVTAFLQNASPPPSHPAAEPVAAAPQEGPGIVTKSDQGAALAPSATVEAAHRAKAGFAEAEAVRVGEAETRAPAKWDAEVAAEAAIKARVEAGDRQAARAEDEAIGLRKQAALDQARRDAEMEREAASKAQAEADAGKTQEAARAKAEAIRLRRESERAQAKRDAELAHEEAIKLQAEARVLRAQEAARAQAEAIRRREDAAQTQAQRAAEIAHAAALKVQAEADALKTRDAAQAQARREAELAHDATVKLRAEAEAQAAQETARREADAVRQREEAARAQARRNAEIAHEAELKLQEETEALKGREAARAAAAALRRREEAAQAQAMRDAEIAHEAELKLQAEAEAGKVAEAARAEAEAVQKREETARAQAIRDAEIAHDTARSARAAAEAIRLGEEKARAQARLDEEKLHAAALQAHARESARAQAKLEEGITLEAAAKASTQASTQASDFHAWQEAQWANAEADAIRAREEAARPHASDGSIVRRAEPPDQYLDWEASQIRYRMAGSGSPVLLLHDWGSSLESMDLIFDALAIAYTVVAIDFPGHGKSSGLAEPMGISDFAGLLLAVQHTLQLSKLRIVAHSFGGRAAISFAQAHPGKVAKLVLENTRLVDLDQKSSLHKGKFAAREGESAAQKETFSNVARKDFSLATPVLKSPALLIWGENDPDVATASRDHKLIPGSELVMLKRAGHLAHVEQSGMFLLVTRRFLRDGTLGSPPPPRR